MQAIAIYGTVKEVRLLYRRLGILHIICLSLVVAPPPGVGAAARTDLGPA